ncbi:bifunctional 2-polyprenyl-6-hydroxyphenol methylase/3-demethylubiquinol 3-O-methyltransferase UbiG [Phenylobacterium sp.]|uniref:class I SAM-dependent methyltransferase n=1 Tax=Phenylobacterium sp. TaxID=1871053 RepID=UPI001203D842|nr:class I SAM-dependent methyltransferase [Phenylobacterium sp.]THD61793.1 MAG: class I SAM-dependent methyltransferase [Phenylobacterium sp.]
MPGAEADTTMMVRDTDADWRELGKSNPYWGVISHPDYLTENLTPERIEAFYASGAFHIDPIAADLKALTGALPKGRALDFGCGVGRLAEAMAKYADQVTGVDISPGMLELARKRDKGITYVDAIPDGPFDWVNSFIVFQHIPPPRGEAIVEELLSKLAPGGMASLQLTIWRDEDKVWAKPTNLKDIWRQRIWMKNLPVGHIHMYDYDLSRLVRLFNLAGIDDIRLVSTNHDGHHGVIILGRKAAPAVSKD